MVFSLHLPEVATDTGKSLKPDCPPSLDHHVDKGTESRPGSRRIAASTEVSGARSAVSDWLKSTDYWLLPEITTNLGFLLALIFLAYLIQQKRSPASTMAWLLLVLFLPYVGVPLYLMLGGRKMNRMARRKARVYDRSQSQQTQPGRSQHRAILVVLWRPSGHAGNRVELLTEGEQAFQRLVGSSTRRTRRFISPLTSLATTRWARRSWTGWRGRRRRRRLRPVAAGRSGIMASRQAPPGASLEGRGQSRLLHAHAARAVPGAGQSAKPSQDRRGRQPRSRSRAA